MRTITDDDLFVFAAMGGRLSLLQERRRSVSDINFNHPEQGSALFQVAHREFTHIVQWLLAEGADPNNYFEQVAGTPLDAAMNAGEFRNAMLLWRAGGNLRCNELLPLHEAPCGRGNLIEVRLSARHAGRKDADFPPLEEVRRGEVLLRNYEVAEDGILLLGERTSKKTKCLRLLGEVIHIWAPVARSI